MPLSENQIAEANIAYRFDNPDSDELTETDLRFLKDNLRPSEIHTLLDLIASEPIDNATAKRITGTNPFAK